MTEALGIYRPAGPVAIHEGTLARLEDLTGYGGRILPVRTLPTKDEDLPAACVHHNGEQLRPDGDANAGPPRFGHTLNLLISLVARADSAFVLQGAQRRSMEEVKETLFTDSSWLNLFEAIESVNCTYHWPRQEEVLLCEARLELMLFYRSAWPPVALNPLDEVDVTFQLTPAADAVTYKYTIPE
jgi:hypothetical protein